MKQALFILLALCTLSAAMVPRLRREIEAVRYCNPQTPCGWLVYEPKTRISQLVVKNTYCQCSSDMVCKSTEDDSSVNAYVQRCRSATEGIDENPVR